MPNAARCGDKPEVFILVVAWNNWRDTIECLETLVRLDYPNFRMVVINNGSTDETLQRMRDWAEHRRTAAPNGFEASMAVVEYDRQTAERGGAEREESLLGTCAAGERLVFINTGQNLGYGGGNNVGMRYALSRGAKYVWILNNDVAVHPSSLSEMVQTAEDSPIVGMVGSKVLYYDRPSVIQAAGGGRFDPRFGICHVNGEGEEDAGQWDRPLNTYLLGASLLVRCELVRAIGLIDESFFHYCEETEWQVRADKLGWSIVYCPSSRVWHKDGRSLEARSPRSDYYYIRNCLMLVRKHFPGNVLMASIYHAYRCVLPKIVRCQFSRLRYAAMAYVDFFRGKKGQLT